MTPKILLQTGNWTGSIYLTYSKKQTIKKMREIKFRVVNRKNEVVAYEMFHISFGWHHVIVSELNELGGEAPLHTGMFYDEIDRSFRDEYTGLLDKNGKEIYESDCDKAGNVVEFINGCWTLNGDRPLSRMLEIFEVIGNIYQHPDLVNPSHK